MRETEIKFRAWHYERKEFCYAELINIGSWIFTPDNPDPKMFGLTELPIYSAPQQYTGLKDKNGVEIYEEDIVKNGWLKNNPVELISWNDAVARFNIGNSRIEHGDAQYIEVIGNIHENPELLT